MERVYDDLIDKGLGKIATIGPKGRLFARYDKRRQGRKTEDIKDLDGRIFAILVNGEKVSPEIQRICNKLQFYVPKENLVVLEGDGNPRKLGRYAASKEDIFNAFDYVRKNAEPTDRLFFYMMRHGDIKDGIPLIKLYSEIMDADEFEIMAKDLPVNYGVFHFTQCSGGGFAERIGKGRYIGISNCSKYEDSLNFSRSSNQDLKMDFVSEIFKPGISINDAFDNVVLKTTGLLERIALKALTEFKAQTPQLFYENADPSKLHFYGR